MAIQRHFLGWHQPALPAVAEFLAERYCLGQDWDLSRVIVVTPGTRAGNRLLEIMVDLASQRKLSFRPPTITTEGRLPERLYQPKRELASELVQQLTWMKVLRQMPHEKRRHLLPFPPAETDATSWLQLSELMQRLHQELAADGLDFSDVLHSASKMEGFNERPRWQTLVALQKAYLEQLDALDLWDLQTARLVAIDYEEFHTDNDVVLVGTVDLNRAMRKILDQIADRTTALIHAPAELASAFDQYGCLIQQHWCEAPINLQDEQIQRVDGPAEQAEAVTQWMATLADKYRAEDVIVGVPDSGLVPQLQRQLAQCGVESRWIEGQRVAETGPYRLLQAVGRYSELRRFDDLAELARHVDVQHWLQRQLKQLEAPAIDPIVALDEYYCDHLPTRLEAERLARELETATEEAKLHDNSYNVRTRDVVATVLATVRAIEELVQELPDHPQPLSDWADALRGVIVTVYADRQIDRTRPADRYLFETCRKINDRLGALSELPKSVEPVLPLGTALELVLRPLSRDFIAPAAQTNAVELLGWLELVMDDAPALAVTTFNDGFVPQSASADAFLPNRLRQKLGLLDNDRRYARDAYALSALAHSRKTLKLIVAHRDAQNNPLAPSRLLFATDPETVARRALRLFAPLESSGMRRSLWPEAKHPPRISQFVIPQPKPCDRPIDRLSVTQFKSYLACPYRFYLRHVLRLESITDSAVELDAAMFGDLVHYALQEFGRADDKIRHSTSEDVLIGYLNDRLSRLAHARYGEHLGRPAIRVQIEQARARLKAFARWQAERTASGWRIAYSEDFNRRLSASFDVDGQPLTLQGRIDRIDVHPKTGAYLILDYKTSDSANSPEKAHRKRDGQWVDLQLPLYRHLLSDVSIDDGPPLDLSDPEERDRQVQLGYINLPKDVDHVGLQLAEWDASLLREADDTAREVVRKIRKEIFWPPSEVPPAFSEDLAAICQDRLLSRWTPDCEGGKA